MKVYKCDGKECKNEVEDLERGWISIGSKDGHSLNIKSSLVSQSHYTLNNYTDLHFCSEKCLIDKILNRNQVVLNE